MSFKFWDQLKQLFQEAADSSPAQPAVHEVLQRSEDEAADYERWKQTLTMRRMVDWLHGQYAVYRVRPKDIDEALDFLDTPSAKGFVVHFHQTNYTRREVSHLAHYLREKVLAEGYRSQLSDTRTYSRPQWVETVERYYLKPRPNFSPTEPAEQLYGNVKIEIELRNDAVQMLRFSATVYHDRQYKPARDFHELMQVVLG